MLRNTPTFYGSIAKFFHWTVSILVICMLIFGFCLSSIPEDYQGTAYNLHKLTGVTILLLMVLRALWALTNVKPLLPADMPQWQQSAARVVHLLLYVTVIAMPLSGWLGAILESRPPHLGDWQITLPLAKNEALAGFAFDMHGILAFTIITLLCLHIAAALYHHFVRKDNILRRMLPGNSVGGMR